MKRKSIVLAVATLIAGFTMSAAGGCTPFRKEKGKQAN